MNHSDTPEKGSKAYRILRPITVVFAVAGPLAMISSAIAITLYEGDWWFNLFAVYLAAIVMISGTLYLSLLTLMQETLRYLRSKARSASHVLPFIKWIHRLLIGASLAGMITSIPFFLILYDLLHGGFAIPHFVCGGMIAVLYLVLGVCTGAERLRARRGN